MPTVNTAWELLLKRSIEKTVFPNHLQQLIVKTPEKSNGIFEDQMLKMSTVYRVTRGREQANGGDDDAAIDHDQDTRRGRHGDFQPKHGHAQTAEIRG